MISTLSQRWYLVLRHLAHNSTVGMGFVLILLGFLLQENDSGFLIYCLVLGVLLSVGTHRKSMSFQPVEAPLMLFGLLLVFFTDNPLTDGILFRQFLMPVACALIVAGWVRSGMVSSTEDSAKQTSERLSSETTTKGTGQ